MADNAMITHEPTQQASGMVEVAASRQAQEVQALAIMAKRFPRDETSAITRIVESCKRVKLAECAMYSYPRGGTKVTGPSIRLAETMARCWGNLDFGIVELEQRGGESDVMAYCWDLETNVRQTKVFTVKHLRHTRQGDTTLTDPRDIYEMTANQGARRLRACILGVIPGDVQDSAVEQCEKTLSGGSGEPLIDRIRKMVVAFADMGVTQEMLEGRLQHPIASCNEQDFIALRKIFVGLKDGMSAREDWFELPTATSSKKPGSKTEQMAADVKKTTKGKGKEKKKPDEPKPDPEPEKPAGPPVVPSTSKLDKRYLAEIVGATATVVGALWVEYVAGQKDALSEDDYILGTALRNHYQQG